MNTYQIINTGDMKLLYHPEHGIIPADPENRDYAAYLEWVAEGNKAQEVSHEISPTDSATDAE